MALPSREALFIDRDAELLSDAVYVIDVEVNEAFWRRVAPVFG
jgi:hypothetical protein